MSQPPCSPITVFLVDHSELARAGLATVLARDQRFTVLGDVASIVEAVPHVAQLSPDLVVVDPAEGDQLDPTHLTPILTALPHGHVCIRTHIFTMEAYLHALTSDVVQGYLLKSDGDAWFVRESLALISHSQAFITDRAIRVHLRGTPGAPTYPLLGPRERLYLERRARGWTHQQIAAADGVSVSSIKRTRAKVQRTLQSASAVPFVLGAQAAALGLLEPR